MFGSISVTDTIIKHMAGKVLRRELAHWLLELNRHGERVTSQPESADVCVCVCMSERERGSEDSVCNVVQGRGENGNVIEKVEEVKGIQREEEKVSGPVFSARELHI